MRCLCPKVYRGGAHTIPAWEGRCPDCPTTPPLFETRWHPELCPFPPGNWCSADSDLPPVTSSLKACSLGSETPQGALAVSPRHSLDADPNLPPCPPFILLAWQNAPPPSSWLPAPTPVGVERGPTEHHQLVPLLLQNSQPGQHVGLHPWSLWSNPFQPPIPSLFLSIIYRLFLASPPGCEPINPSIPVTFLCGEFPQAFVLIPFVWARSSHGGNLWGCFANEWGIFSCPSDWRGASGI